MIPPAVIPEGLPSGPTVFQMRDSNMPNMNPTTRRHASGFTLIELLVVIAIIAVLAGLLLGGAAVLKEGGKESQARAVLASLMGHAGQFENQFSTAGIVAHLGNSSPYFWEGNTKHRNAEGASGETEIKSGTGTDLAGDDNGDYTYSNGDTNDEYMERANLYMKRFIWAVNQMPVIRDGLPSLGAAFDDFDDDGFLEIIDPWGNPIAYASSVTHGIAANTDDDFLPMHKNPFFASAGKDQMWGRPQVRGEFGSDAAWDAYTQTDEYKFSVDNLYSFDIDRSAAQRGD
jgi:prepilin-type N-terminal cleavage/methylation domain-containing protein